MNQTLRMPYRRSFFAIAICVIALFCVHPPATFSAEKKAASEPAKSQEAGRLVIVRAANLGSSVVGISIDGKEVAKLNFGGKYDAPISAGPHTISSIAVPDREHGGKSDHKLTVESGKTYTLTAKRDDVRIALK